MDAEEVGGAIGKILGLATNLGIQILIIRWITTKFLFGGDKRRLKAKHYFIFLILSVFIYVFIRASLGTLDTF